MGILCSTIDLETRKKSVWKSFSRQKTETSHKRFVWICEFQARFIKIEKKETSENSAPGKLLSRGFYDANITVHRVDFHLHATDP